MEGNAGAAGEAGDRQAAVADEVIGRRDESGQRRVDGGARDLRQNGVAGRALPVAGDEDGNIVLIGTGMAGRPAPLARRARQVGPSPLEGFEDEGLIRLDNSA